MNQFLVRLHDQSVEIQHPPELAADIAVLFDGVAGQGAGTGATISIERQGDERFSICSGPGRETAEYLTRQDLLNFLMEAVGHHLVADIDNAVAIHAGAVLCGDKAILIPGPSGSGKSSCVAWLVDHGFGYVTDETVVFDPADGTLVGYTRGLVAKPGADVKVAAMKSFADAAVVEASGAVVIAPPFTPGIGQKPQRCGMIVFPHFDPAADESSIEPMSAGLAGLGLLECNLNARNLTNGGLASITELARSVPAVSLRYGDFDQLEGVLDVLARLVLKSDLSAQATRSLLSSFVGKKKTIAKRAVVAKRPPTPPPAATPRGTPKRLTIGMATYDDFDGAFFSLQAVRMYHPEVLDDIEFLVIDNNPTGPCAEALKALDEKVPGYRYVPMAARSGTAVRDYVFEEASGEIVLCMDSHVLIVPGALKKLLDYFEADPQTNDLLQGPIIFDELTEFATHFEPKWSAGMYGTWEKDDRAQDPDGPPFDIPMMGLGLFACRRAAWPGFNEAFRGFGGEEGYIHEKIRRAGGRTLCLPFLRWLHRFQRPLGVPYANLWDDRIRNYAIGLDELGLARDAMEKHFREFLDPAVVEPILESIQLERGAIPAANITKIDG